MRAVLAALAVVGALYIAGKVGFEVGAHFEDAKLKALIEDLPECRPPPLPGVEKVFPGDGVTRDL